MRKPIPIYSIIAVLLSCALSSFAQAGRPLLTDDATITDDCQLESWWQRESSGHAFWQLPACNVGGVELAIGGAKGKAQRSTFLCLLLKRSYLH